MLGFTCKKNSHLPPDITERIALFESHTDRQLRCYAPILNFAKSQNSNCVELSRPVLRKAVKTYNEVNCPERPIGFNDAHYVKILEKLFAENLIAPAIPNSKLNTLKKNSPSLIFIKEIEGEIPSETIKNYYLKNTKQVKPEPHRYPNSTCVKKNKTQPPNINSNNFSKESTQVEETVCVSKKVLETLVNKVEYLTHRLEEHMKQDCVCKNPSSSNNSTDLNSTQEVTQVKLPLNNNLNDLTESIDSVSKLKSNLKNKKESIDSFDSLKDDLKIIPKQSEFQTNYEVINLDKLFSVKKYRNIYFNLFTYREFFYISCLGQDYRSPRAITSVVLPKQINQVGKDPLEMKELLDHVREQEDTATALRAFNILITGLKMSIYPNNLNHRWKNSNKNINPGPIRTAIGLYNSIYRNPERYETKMRWSLENMVKSKCFWFIKDFDFNVFHMVKFILNIQFTSLLSPTPIETKILDFDVLLNKFNLPLEVTVQLENFKQLLEKDPKYKFSIDKLLANLPNPDSDSDSEKDPPKEPEIPLTPQINHKKKIEEIKVEILKNDVDGIEDFI